MSIPSYRSGSSESNTADGLGPGYGALTLCAAILAADIAVMTSAVIVIVGLMRRIASL